MVALAKGTGDEFKCVSRLHFFFFFYNMQKFMNILSFDKYGYLDTTEYMVVSFEL